MGGWVEGSFKVQVRVMARSQTKEKRHREPGPYTGAQWAGRLRVICEPKTLCRGQGRGATLLGRDDAARTVMGCATAFPCLPDAVLVKFTCSLKNKDFGWRDHLVENHGVSYGLWVERGVGARSSPETSVPLGGGPVTWESTHRWGQHAHGNLSFSGNVKLPWKIRCT